MKINDTEMKNTLENIESLISTYTAIQYATERLNKTTEDDLIACYGSIDPEPIQKTKDRAFASYLTRYADTVDALSGFYKMGKVFCLDRHNKIIFFVAGQKKGIARLITQYNPLNVDCIESACSEKQLFENSTRFDFSLNEKALIEELDNLILVKS